jgi:hypothetical protein
MLAVESTEKPLQSKNEQPNILPFRDMENAQPILAIDKVASHGERLVIEKIEKSKPCCRMRRTPLVRYRYRCGGNAACMKTFISAMRKGGFL